jgi:glycosyltransferase involved in cell wall biosynthesis
MKRAGIPVVVLSTAAEQSPGFHDKLRAAQVTMVDDPSLDVADVSSIRDAAEVVASLCVPGLNVLHAEGIRHTIAGWLAKRLLPKNKRLAVTTMLGAMRNASRIWPLYYAAGSAILNIAADKVLLLCGEEKRKMVHCGLRPSKADVGYFPVDNGTSFQAKPDLSRLAGCVADPRVYNGSRRKVVYLAEFRRAKRHKPLIRAWREVCKHFPDLLLVLAGSGPMFQECSALVARLGLSNNICLLPRIPREAVPGLLSLCSYGVVTSRAETFGSCIVEPLLAGLPVCTTPVGIARELAAVGGVHLLETLAPGPLAEQMCGFFSNENRALSQMECGRSWVVDHCAESKFVARLTDGWAELAENSLETSMVAMKL